MSVLSQSETKEIIQDYEYNKSDWISFFMLSLYWSSWNIVMKKLYYNNISMLTYQVVSILVACVKSHHQRPQCQIFVSCDTILHIQLKVIQTDGSTYWHNIPFVLLWNHFICGLTMMNMFVNTTLEFMDFKLFLILLKWLNILMGSEIRGLPYQRITQN